MTSGANPIGEEMPDAEQYPVDEIVERVLTLLADSADRNCTHPLAEPTIWLVAHALREPKLPRSQVDLGLELPGLTLPLARFELDAAFFRRLDSSRQDRP